MRDCMDCDECIVMYDCMDCDGCTVMFDCDECSRYSSPPRRSYPEDDYNTERTHGGNGSAHCACC
eukprot:m.225428 g.225428  ORF g.225428 m.225428 type:complete len:65 (+) comp19206_c0_seq5:401-595(+)